MHALAVRSFPTVAAAARAPRCLHRALLHSSPPRLSSTNGSGANGAKPVDESSFSSSSFSSSSSSAIEHHEEPGETLGGGRLRGHATSAARNRHLRRKPVSALPPIALPRAFLDNNVSLYDPAEQPRLPPALAEDARHAKPSRLPSATTHASPRVYKALETYFDTALGNLLLRDCELAMDFMKSRFESGKEDGDENENKWNSSHEIAKVVRVWDMIIDSAWHLTDAICQRPAVYEYKTRPFWWWHMHKDLDYRTLKFRDEALSLAISLRDHFSLAEQLDHPLPHALADLPVDTFVALQKAVDRELAAAPPPTFDFKSSKRPITVLALSGYSGRSVAEATAAHMAYLSGADLIRMDAYDMSEVVGDYLGQNWAHSRGPLSMLGFRAAELNGKLRSGQDSAAAKPGDEEEQQQQQELDHVVNVRSVSGTLEEELQKIKQGGFECFTKWENLKIDKILDHVIRSADLKSQSQSQSQPESESESESPEPRNRPVLLHIHDLVELSMTLEGSLLINRLRSLVDAAWQQGTKIAIFGTSSCAQPSEEYQTAIQDLSALDFVVTRHIEPDRAADLLNLNLNLNPNPNPNITKQPKSTTGLDAGLDAAGLDAAGLDAQLPFHLEKTDFFAENISNMRTMLRALDPEASSSELDLSSAALKLYLQAQNPRVAILRDSVLTAPEIYHLAMAYRSYDSRSGGWGPAGLVERFGLGPLRQRPGQGFLDEEWPEAGADGGESSKSEEAHKAEVRTAAALKLNEYEKRISSGQINKDNLRVTFADVHAPAETISALKLLTSLALVRPDAFSYGVLAVDKIPGCLLYGPPGTGKTMLAKAVAKESGANILEISGASINDKWVGESEKLIRAVFTLAKKLSPCVVFIDEADSLLANRSMFSNRASHREHINQFLKEWDGMEETTAFIMVATNRPFDLDDAVLRRLPRKILVDLPLQKDRLAILQLLLRGESLDTVSVSLEALSHRTPYYSGSDLKNVCVAAAMAAVEEENEAAARHTGAEPFRYPERRVLTGAHFDKALKQIPSSISEDMVSLKMIRKFDEEYGNKRRGGRKSGMGFGMGEDEKKVDVGEALIRPPPA